MALNQATITKLRLLLPVEEIQELTRLASEQDALEGKWRRKLKAHLESLETQVIQGLRDTGEVPKDLDFGEFFADQAKAVTRKAVIEARRTPSQITATKLAAGKTLKQWMDIWDRWRRKGKVPPRQKALGEKIRKAYVRKCQDVWRKHAEEFREGKSFDMQKARDVIAKATKPVYSRAKMIVETETTRYYNEVRREVYDSSPDVTHYLFVAVRDHATTKWCKTRTGLVYAKGDPLLDKETPPIHWNCRSELLPLTKLNPRHLALIENESLQRRRHSCEPLPKDWNRVGLNHAG